MATHTALLPSTNSQINPGARQLQFIANAKITNCQHSSVWMRMSISVVLSFGYVTIVTMLQLFCLWSVYRNRHLEYHTQTEPVTERSLSSTLSRRYHATSAASARLYYSCNNTDSTNGPREFGTERSHPNQREVTCTRASRPSLDRSL